MFLFLPSENERNDRRNHTGLSMRATIQNRTPGYNGRISMGSRSNTPTNFTPNQKRKQLSDDFNDGNMPGQSFSYVAPRHTSRSSSVSCSRSCYSMDERSYDQHHDSRSICNNRSHRSHRNRQRKDLPEYVMSPPKNRDIEQLTEPQYEGGQYEEDEETGLNGDVSVALLD